MSRRKQRLREVVPKLRHVYAYFWPQIRRYRATMAWSMLALLASVVFRLLEPWPLKIFLDNVLAGNGRGGAPPLGIDAARHLTPQQLLLFVAASVVVIVGLRSLTDYISRVGFFVVGNKVVIKIRDRIYRHLQRLSLAYHAKARTGDLIIRVTRDVSLLRDVTGTAMLPLIASTAVLIGMIGVMFYLSWQLTLLALATLPLFWLTTARLGKRIRQTARRQRQREGAMATTAAEAMGAIQVIQAMSLEEKFARAFSMRNAKSQKDDLRASRLSIRLGRLIDVLLSVSTALVLYFGGKLALSGQMTAGDIVVFLTYLKRSFKPAQEFAKYVARLAKAAAAGERVIEILELEPEIQDATDAIEADVFQGRIVLEHVDFAYEKNCPVLSDVSLTVQRGEMVALVGPSGGGKSTILAHVLRLVDPDAGSVQIDGQDIRRFTLMSVRLQMTSVMQEALLLADTVRDNIGCVVDGASDEQIIAAARLAQAHEFIVQLPHGYDTKIGERGATLSRGQRQRLAIARAAMRNAPIVLLDEPTTGLDETNERVVTQSLVELARGRTALVATHNLALAAQAARIVFVDAGSIVEQGTHAELVAKGGRYATWVAENASRRGTTSAADLKVVS